MMIKTATLLALAVAFVSGGQAAATPQQEVASRQATQCAGSLNKEFCGFHIETLKCATIPELRAIDPTVVDPYSAIYEVDADGKPYKFIEQCPTGRCVDGHNGTPSGPTFCRA